MPANGTATTTPSTAVPSCAGQPSASSSRRSGCGTSCSTTGRRTGSRPSGCWPTRAIGSAGSTASCCGTPTRSSASTTATSGTSTATSRGSPIWSRCSTTTEFASSSTTTPGTSAPAGQATTLPSSPPWSPTSRSTASSSTPSRRAAGPSSAASTPPGPASPPEGESTVALPRVVDHPLSWAQWFADSPVPGVVRSHFYERRHQMHHVRRWNRGHTEELQSAWFNGIGVMVWEVVFGAWVGWSDRDAQALRRMTRAQRALSHLLRRGRVDAAGRPRRGRTGRRRLRLDASPRRPNGS